MAINRGSGISAGPGSNSGSGIGGAGIAVVPAGGGPVSFDFSGGSLPVGAALTRSSIGTYFDASGVMQSAAIDTARFDYIYDGSVWSLAGLLVEPQRTNISLNSQALNAGGGWNPARVTVTDDALAAPDGTTTAELVVPSADSGTHLIGRSSTQTVAQVWTLSEFLRPGAGSYRAAMTLQNAVEADAVQANVNLGAPAITVQNLGQGSGAVGRLSLLNDGWLRASLTGTPDANGTSLRSTCFVANSGGSLSYVGDATNGIYVWGIQTELGAFPTSYIPTTGSAATRSADVLTLTIPTGTYDMEAVTPTGTYQGPGVSVTGGAYVFDWSDFVGATTETRLTVLSATPA